MLKVHKFSIGADAKGGDSPLKAALRDYCEGVGLWRVWIMLGWHDIRQRYRRSVIGPFWISLNTAIMVGALGYVYSALFEQNISYYLPFISVGIVVWSFVSSVLMDATTVYTNSEGMLKQVRLPITFYVCRMVWRNLIIFAHNSVIIIAVIIYLDSPLSIELLLLPLSMLAICFNGINIGLILGIFCTRFRDIAQLVASLIQLLFFVTPIMWSPGVFSNQNVDKLWIANYNPAFYFIEIIRSPVLGAPTVEGAWLIIILISVLTWLMAILALTKCRHRVTYWL